MNLIAISLAACVIYGVYRAVRRLALVLRWIT